MKIGGKLVSACRKIGDGQWGEYQEDEIDEDMQGKVGRRIVLVVVVRQGQRRRRATVVAVRGCAVGRMHIRTGGDVGGVELLRI